MKTRTNKKLLAIFLALCMALTMLPATIPTAVAASDIDYIGADGKPATAAAATEVTDTTTALGTAGSTAWYVVNGEVTISDRITVSGDVHLILADGCTLDAP